jgi:hypothetical protein
MEPAALRDALVELARGCGVAVRVLRGGSEGVAGLASGPALVRGAPWIVLVASDPVGAQIDALASGLDRFARAALAARFLPPAVREVLDRTAGTPPR